MDASGPNPRVPSEFANMKTLLVLSSLVLGSTALLAFATKDGHGHDGDHDNDHRRFRAELRGKNEVPPVDTHTRGEIDIHFAEDYSSATLRFDLEDGERITQAHFHCGDEGTNGPIVIFLAGFHDRGWDIDGRWLDHVTITDQNIVNDTCGTTLRDIADGMRDGHIYVNAHSVEFPSGVVRGQMHEDDDDHHGDDDDGDDDHGHGDHDDGDD